MDERTSTVDRLVARARGGDGAAFAALVRTFDPMLRGLVYNLLGDRELMDDVLQETYLRAFRALPGFEGRAQIGTWLYRIAYTASLDELRRRKRGRWLPLVDARLDEAAAPTEDLDERLSVTNELRAALARLSPEERAAVWLVDAEGLDYRQAAAVLDVPEGTVASRLSRARATLRLAFGEETSR